MPGRLMVVKGETNGKGNKTIKKIKFYSIKLEKLF